ncbi:glycosyl hydrolase [Fomitopsis betulina]|nr:glycosyl hydrolase [Fomitopsis betulina]
MRHLRRLRRRKTPRHFPDVSGKPDNITYEVQHTHQDNQYVMWIHLDSSKWVDVPAAPDGAKTCVASYGLAMVGVATADTPCGAIAEVLIRWEPSLVTNAFFSMNIIRHADEQTAYLLHASDNNQNFKISQMVSNYYNVTEVVAELKGATLEAPGMVKRDGVCWLFASHTSEWAPNPNKYLYADSISGTWSSQADIAPEDTNTYYSQNAYDLPLGTNAIYMGDRWESSLLGNSRYMWYPLSWSSGDPQIVYADLWTVDLAAGTYSVLNGTVYAASSGTLSGSSELLGSGYPYNTIKVSDIWVLAAPADQWLALYYANGDSTWRNVTVSVNSGSSVVVYQPSTGGGHVVFSVPILVHLNEGLNTVTFGADQSNYAGDLYEVIVYTQT